MGPDAHDTAAAAGDRLRAMKLGHEAWVSQEDFVPGLPIVSVQTYGGLALGLDAALTRAAQGRPSDFVIVFWMRFLGVASAGIDLEGSISE